MKKELAFGNRIMFVDCEDKHSARIFELFYELIKKGEDELSEIMDRYEIPEQIVLNFRSGDGTLEGVYYKQREEVEKHVIIIDMFTHHLKIPRRKAKMGELKLDLVDTFIHELVHHKYKSEEKTSDKAGKLAKEVMKCLQKHV